jgi:hypothetical protein
LAKIKKLRYEGMLKYGENPEKLGEQRFLEQLKKARLEMVSVGGKSTEKIVLVIEDGLAKNWIQAKIKEVGVYDGSFNPEILKVSPEVFFRMLGGLFKGAELSEFNDKYEKLSKTLAIEKRNEMFKEIAINFATSLISELPKVFMG